MADGREPVVGLWRSQPRRSSDSRCDCALRGRARYFNHVVNHSSSRVSEVSQLGLEKRGGSHCTAIRRKPRHSQRTAFPILFNLQRDTITCIRWQERAQRYHVTESRLRASAAAVILQSDLEVARTLLFEFFFFPAWAKKNKKKTRYLFICLWSPARMLCCQNWDQHLAEGVVSNLIEVSEPFVTSQRSLSRSDFLLHPPSSQ